MPDTWIPYLGDGASLRYWVGLEVPPKIGHYPWRDLPIGGAIVTEDEYMALTCRASIYQYSGKAKKKFRCRFDGKRLVVARTA